MVGTMGPTRWAISTSTTARCLFGKVEFKPFRAQSLSRSRHEAQANSWSAVSVSSVAAMTPDPRYALMMVWSAAPDGFYVFGGFVTAGSPGPRNDPHFYDRQVRCQLYTHPTRLECPVQANTWSRPISNKNRRPRCPLNVHTRWRLPSHPLPG